jgi:hypothetical protein
MKRVLTAVSVLFLSFGSLAHAHDFSPEPQPSADQVIKYDRGDAKVFSNMANSSVAVSVLPITEYNSGNVTFAISFKNGTSSDVLMDPDTISVVLASGKPVKIVTANELERKARNDAAWASAASSLGSLSRATLGSQPTTIASTSTYDGSTANSVSTIRNPSQQLRDIQNNQTQSQNELQGIQNDLSAKLDQIRGTVIQKTTVDAAGSDGGTLLVQVPNLKKEDDKTLTLSVRFAGDEHVFRYTMNKFKP